MNSAAMLAFLVSVEKVQCPKKYRDFNILICRGIGGEGLVTKKVFGILFNSGMGGESIYFLVKIPSPPKPTLTKCRNNRFFG
jgi:hypothetical protein